MSTNKNRRILIIDDNRAIHDDFRKILAAREASQLDDIEDALFGSEDRVAREHYDMDSAFQGEEGFLKVVRSIDEGAPYALAFVDMRMPPGWDGVETIARIWAVDPEIQIVICTAYSDYSWEDILARFGAADQLLILKKPFDTAEVCQLTCALTEKWHLARHASLKLSQLKSMVEEQTRELTDANSRLKEEIVQRRSSELALRESEDRYALAIAGANDGLWDWDYELGSIFYSSRWKSMLGFSGDQISGSPDEWLGRVHDGDRARFEESLSAHVRGEIDHLHCEYRMLHADGQYRWILCRGLAVRAAAGQVRRIAGSQTDITDRRMAEEQLRHAAFHDTLTGLANRALLMERLERCLLREKRREDSPFAVLFLDLDRFKVINDSLGHMVGDKLLIALARRLTARVRALDTLALVENSQLARFGGDEFVLLLEHITEPASIIGIAERLKQAVAEPFLIDGHEILTGVSIGVALSHTGYERPEDILRDADIALYRAKEAGRGTCQLFDPKMHASAMERWQMENDLRHGIERGELRLHFQPIMSVTTGAIAEFEALVRWQHPERGMVPPNDFIPLAEETGLIGPLGLWVLREACLQLKRWQPLCAGGEPLSVAVNVSSKQLTQTDIVPQIRGILEETGVDPRQVILEITESVLLEGAAATMARLAELRGLGLRFHLDDFGTGYSSLSYLHRMPVHALKIDRSFVSRMGDDPMSASIVQTIVALAHALGIQVIAEGVETRTQLEQLRELRCDATQGYYFSRPLDAAKATALLEEASARAQLLVA